MLIIFSSIMQLKRITKDILCGICRPNLDAIKMQGLQSKQISGVIIHCITVFYQKENVEFLKPCAELLKNLSSMKVNLQLIQLTITYSINNQQLCNIKYAYIAIEFCFSVLDATQLSICVMSNIIIILQNMYLPTMPEVCEFKSDLQLMGTYYSEQLVLCLQCDYNVSIQFVMMATDFW